MSSKSANAGSPNSRASKAGNPVEEAGFWDHEAVEDRLVDTLNAWRRTPVEDARFCIGGRISSIWSRVLADPLALVDRVGLEEEAPRSLPLSRADIARRDEASEWMQYVPERDRRLVAEVLAFHARNANADEDEKQVPWLKLWVKLGRGKPGPDGLRMRYSRALTAVCVRLNAAENRANGLSR